eukprot:jgi/Picsp_1/3075/NSC_01297-R1_atp-dependent rna helicase ddx11-like protein 8-like
MTGVNQGKPCLATATLNRLSVDHPVKFCAGSNDHKCFEAFPYDAYDIQIDFMRKLYETLECGGIGLFESPTGTGKTMSLICGSLHWLEDHRKRVQEGSQPSKSGECSDDEPDWMKEFDETRIRERKRMVEEKRQARISSGKARLEKLQATKLEQEVEQVDENSEEEYLIHDGTDESKLIGQKRVSSYLDASSSTDEEIEDFLQDDDLKVQERTQIIFCSRTHSQLMQFVGELKKTRFRDCMSLVSLGSRKALCVNPDVQKLGSPAMMNERCMDLQKTKTKNKKQSDPRTVINSKCPYLRRGSKSSAALTDMILAEPMDIEDLASLGEKRATCPYYAARDAAIESDIVLAPYTSLLVQESREALGLNVKGSIIIIDEAHNLVDAINNSHSATLTMREAEDAKKQLDHYFQRFRSRLSAYNARTIQKLIHVTNALIKGFGQNRCQEVITANDFLFSLGLDNMNMFQLGREIKDNKLVFKIGGLWKSFRAKAEKDRSPMGGKYMQDEGHSSSDASNCLHSLLNFLRKLTFDNSDGRIIVEPETNAFKYVMLNASNSFQGILQEARAVVLASGTLSPLETVLHLFRGKPSSSVLRYSCDHIIDSTRLVALAVPSGPSGHTFDFRHATRSDGKMVAELGRALSNISKVTPGGIVAFFPSFKYVTTVYNTWRETGVLSQIEKMKKVFMEPKTAAEVDSVLNEYSKGILQGINRQAGSIMLAVVGGKLSEGINFGDDMGRCVIMVGLPYPNPSDPELKERMNYMDRSFAETIGDSESAIGKAALSSREYYTNLCMKAVNQCIGRAIRHKQDYASIILLDYRYRASIGSTPGGIASKLPGWIVKSMQPVDSFGEAQGRLARFFKKYQQGQEHS